MGREARDEVPDPWLLDSGASDPMSPVVSDFEYLVPSSRTVVRLADGSTVPVLGEGPVLVLGREGPVRLLSVLFVPALACRLLSVAAIYDHGGKVLWGKQEVQVLGEYAQRVLLSCKRTGSAWQLHAAPYSLSGTAPDPAMCLLCAQSGAHAVQGSGPAQVVAPWHLWHARLGHVHVQGLKSMHQHGFVDGLRLTGEIPKTHDCAPCFEGKMQQMPFPKPETRATAPFQRLHMDLLGSWKFSPSVPNPSTCCC